MRRWKIYVAVVGLLLAVGIFFHWPRQPRTEVPESDVQNFWERRLGPLYPERLEELLGAYRVLFTLSSLLDLYALWSGEMPTSWSALQADFPMAVDWDALGEVFGEPVRLVDQPSEKVGSIWLGMWQWASTEMWTIYLRAPDGIIIRMPVTNQELIEEQRNPEGFLSVFLDEREWVESLAWEDRAWYLTCTLLERLPGRHGFARKAFADYYPPQVAEWVPEQWETPEQLIYESFFIGEVLRNPYTGEDLRSSLTREPTPHAILWRALQMQPSGKRWVFGCLDREGALLNPGLTGWLLVRADVRVRLREDYPRDLLGYDLLKDYLSPVASP